MATRGELHPLRLLSRRLQKRQLDSPELLDIAGSDGVLGFEQVQQREIAQQNLAEEKDGLEADIAAQLLVGGVGGEQLGVRRFVGR